MEEDCMLLDTTVNNTTELLTTIGKLIDNIHQNDIELIVDNMEG